MPTGCRPHRRRFVLSVAVVALVSLLAAEARAAVGRWNRFGPPIGSFQDLAADPFVPGFLYAIFPEGDVYRSPDGGASWAWSGAGIPREAKVTSIAPDPRHPGRVYAASSTQVFRSEDRGARWTRVSDGSLQLLPLSGGGVFTDARLVATRGNLYLGAGGQVWQSRDGGRAWSPILVTANTFLFLEGDADGVLYAGLITGGIIRRQDRGTGWRTLPGLPADAQIDSFAAVPSRPRTLYAAGGSTLYRSDDRGESWRDISPPGGHLVTALAVDPAAPRVVYAARESDVAVSEDSGASWRATGEGVLEGLVRFLAFDPAGRTVHAASHFDLAASADRGRTWARHLASAADDVVSLLDRDRLRFDTARPGRVLAVADGSLFLSADGGRTWRASPGQVGSRLGRFDDASFDPVRPAWLWAGAGRGLYRSRDGGSTWDLLNGDIAEVGALSFLGPRTLLAAGYGIHRSADRGRTWTQVLGPETGDHRTRLVGDLEVSPENPALVFAHAVLFEVIPPGTPLFSGRERWRSLDGGLTWTQQGAGQVAFDPADREGLYMGDAGGGIWRSPDLGESWFHVGFAGPGSVEAIVADPAAPENLFAALSGERDRVLRSRDAGATWSPAQGGLRRGFSRGLTLDLTADPAVPHRILLTADGAFFEATFP